MIYDYNDVHLYKWLCGTCRCNSGVIFSGYPSRFIAIVKCRDIFIFGVVAVIHVNDC